MKSVSFRVALVACLFFGFGWRRHVTLTLSPLLLLPRPSGGATPAKHIDFDYFKPVKVFSPSKYNETVAMCLIVRNETVYLVRVGTRPPLTYV